MATAFSIDSFRHGSSLATVREIEQGLPASAVREVIDDASIKLSDLVGVVASRRTLDRRLAGSGSLTPEEGDKLVHFAEVVALATHVLGSRQDAMEWLRAPQFEFDEKRPIELMRTHSGTQLVRDLLRQIQYGMLA